MRFTRPHRQPKSNWRSSPLSPNHQGDLKQRWHRRYGRLGRLYDTIVKPGCHSSIEDECPWDADYRRNLYIRIERQLRPRGLVDRAVPDPDLGHSSSQQLLSGGNASANEESLSRPILHGIPGGSGSIEASEDKSEDKHSRYTAAEKGKQREGEDPVAPIARGPSALKPAVRDNLQSLAPKMPGQGLRFPPRRSSDGDEVDEDIPGVEQIEHAEVNSTADARAKLVRIAPAEFLKYARRELGFAAGLPPDGLGVVRDRSSVQSLPRKRSNGSPSSVAMARSRSQTGIPGPSSQAGSATMQRTSTHAGTPVPGSQQLVAKSNRRLDELSPHSAQGGFPDTPMPYLKIETDGEEPIPFSLISASEAEDHSDGERPRPEAPEPYHAPTSPRKRGSDEISGGCVPGPSDHHQPPRPAGSSANFATMHIRVNGRLRPLSEGELQARALQPPPPVQKELCKLYSVLVQVVQVAADEFIVVESHDFIDVLSRGAEVARRVREQATTPNQQYRKLLVPFSSAKNILLAVIDLSVTGIQIFNPRTEDPESSESNDSLEIQESVYDFIHAVFPNKCGEFETWNISFERTVQGPVAINAPGIVSGRYLNELGGNIPLQSILPFFFEVLRVVCGIETRNVFEDEALLKRLFALFEVPRRSENLNAIKSLRAQSQAGFTRSLEGRVKQALQHPDKKFRTMISEVRSGCNPPDLIKHRPKAKMDALNAVVQSQVASCNLMVQYSQIRAMLDGIAHRCTISRSWLHHELVSHMVEKWFYSVDATKTVLEPEAALSQFRSQGLKDIALKIRTMKAELESWLGMLNEHLESAVMR